MRTAVALCLVAGCGWAAAARAPSLCARSGVSRGRTPALTAQPAREPAELPKRTARETLGALVQMSRPRTLPPSVLLLLLGAYAAERNVRFCFIASPIRRELCLLGVLVALTTGTSMLVNDYFDFQNGNDSAGPLAQGRVRPATVKAACKWLYSLHLVLTLLVQAPLTRVVVFANTLATLLYSRHCKPVPVVKNALCASVIATTLLLGAATVTGSFAAGFASVWHMMLLVGGAIGHREMLMDVQDVEEDRLAAVQTVPVLVGAKPALALSCVPLFVLLALSVAQAGLPRLAALPVGAMIALAARAGVAGDLKTRAGRQSVSLAVELAPVLLLLALIVALRV